MPLADNSALDSAMAVDNFYMPVLTAIAIYSTLDNLILQVVSILPQFDSKSIQILLELCLHFPNILLSLLDLIRNRPQFMAVFLRG